MVAVTADSTLTSGSKTCKSSRSLKNYKAHTDGTHAKVPSDSRNDCKNANVHLDSDRMPKYAKTLEFFKSHSTECLSGQDLSDVLGTSRVSIWKHVRALQKLKYDIRSVQNTGYVLAGLCDEPYPWEIAGQTKTKTIAKRVIYHSKIGSTQDAAALLSREIGAYADGTVIIASEQTSARGRSAKRWSSPQGGIWMSIILQPAHIDASRITMLPIGVGVAVVKAVHAACGIQAELRWPNDVTIGGKKLAGIITEADIEVRNIRNIRIGIGINFDLDPAHIQREFSDADGFYGATSIRSEMKGTRNNNSKKKISKIDLVKDVIHQTENVYETLQKGRAGAIASEWSKIPSTIGKRVGVMINGSKITGTATKISDDGMLIVKRDDSGGLGKTARIMSGGLEYL